MDKDLKKLLRALEDADYTVKRTRKGHWLVVSPEGAPVTTIAGTPSDGRGWKNALSALRRSGFRWPKG